MATETEPDPSRDEGRLDERILRTLESIPGRVAFSGLRRVLRAHPESLARALRRLERQRRVERVDGGYRATSPRRGPLEGSLTSDLTPLAEVQLPAGASPDLLLGRLSGRWFGSLRWVGVVDRPEGRVLAWAHADGSGLVLLGIDRGHLRVYVPEPGGPDDPGEAEDAAYELLLHAVEALRPHPGSPGPLTFLRASPSTAERFPLDN